MVEIPADIIVLRVRGGIPERTVKGLLNQPTRIVRVDKVYVILLIDTFFRILPHISLQVPPKGSRPD